MTAAKSVCHCSHSARDGARCSKPEQFRSPGIGPLLFMLIYAIPAAYDKQRQGGFGVGAVGKQTGEACFADRANRDTLEQRANGGFREKHRLRCCVRREKHLQTVDLTTSSRKAPSCTRVKPAVEHADTHTQYRMCARACVCAPCFILGEWEDLAGLFKR